jgi:hypothetical protein
MRAQPTISASADAVSMSWAGFPARATRARVSATRTAMVDVVVTLSGRDVPIAA